MCRTVLSNWCLNGANGERKREKKNISLILIKIENKFVINIQKQFYKCIKNNKLIIYNIIK